MSEPLQPSREALHELRDREACARLELEECRRTRERMAAWMLKDGAPVRSIVDVLGMTHNRLAALRREIGAPAPLDDDRTARILRVAAEYGSDNVAVVARRAGASLSFTYRVLHSRPADGIEQARMNGARARDRMQGQQGAGS